MGNGRISAKQSEILEYIKEEILSKGYPPAVREICNAVHLKSTSSVHSHLETLEKNGYIRRDPTKPRAIEIVDDNFNITRKEMRNIPIIGDVKPASQSSPNKISADIFLFWQMNCLAEIYLCSMYAAKV